VQWRVDKFAAARKHEQTDDSVGYTTDRRRAWNKYVKPLYAVHKFLQVHLFHFRGLFDIRLRLSVMHCLVKLNHTFGHVHCSISVYQE